MMVIGNHFISLNFAFWLQRNIIWPTLDLFACFNIGLEIQIRMPSNAPTQFSMLALALLISSLRLFNVEFMQICHCLHNVPDTFHHHRMKYAIRRQHVIWASTHKMLQSTCQSHKWKHKPILDRRSKYIPPSWPPLFSYLLSFNHATSMHSFSLSWRIQNDTLFCAESSIHQQH